MKRLRRQVRQLGTRFVHRVQKLFTRRRHQQQQQPKSTEVPSSECDDIGEIESPTPVDAAAAAAAATAAETSQLPQLV